MNCIEVFSGNPRDLKTVMGSGGSVLKDAATATDVQIRAALRELPASELAKVQEARNGHHGQEFSNISIHEIQISPSN